MKNVIGQKRAVAAFQKMTRSIRNRCPLPSLALLSAPGHGKTHIVNEWGNELEREGVAQVVRFDFSSRLNVTDDIYKSGMIKIHEALTLHIPTITIADEIGNKGSEGSAVKNFLTFLRAIGNGEGARVVPYGFSEPVQFSSKYLGVVLTTYQTGRMQSDLIGPAGRYQETEDFKLPPYSPQELGEILRLDITRHAALAERALPRMTDAAIHLIAKSMRGNARQSDKIICPAIIRNAADDQGWRLTLETAAELCKEKGIAPHGLSDIERKVLGYLAVKSLKISELQSKCGIGSKEAWSECKNYLEEGSRRDLSPFQLSDREGNEIEGAHGPLIDIVGSSCVLTGHGARMVALLRKGGWL